MNEKPILFSSPMVMAILEGRKTQTRRVVKGTALDWLQPNMFSPVYVAHPENRLSPYGYAGDQLWVRETFRCEEVGEYGVDGVRYKADDTFREIENSQEASDKWIEAYREDGKWRPSIFMPRWASRIQLEIVNVRVERVKSISEEDAKAEGVGAWHDTPRGTMYSPEFKLLWNKINHVRGFGWSLNPWVWVVEFKVVKP